MPSPPLCPPPPLPPRFAAKTFPTASPVRVLHGQVLPLFRPADRRARRLRRFEYIRWFLLHERATVFKEDDDWYLLVHTVCRHCRPTTAAASTKPARRSAATTRPTTANTKTTGPTTSIWKRPEQVAEYTEAVLPRRRATASAAPSRTAAADSRMTHGEARWMPQTRDQTRRRVVNLHSPDHLRRSPPYRLRQSIDPARSRAFATICPRR